MIYIDGERVDLSKKSSYSKILSDAWAELNKKYKLDDGNGITFQRLNDTAVAIDVVDIREKSNPMAVGQMKKFQKLPVSASQMFSDDDGAHYVRYSNVIAKKDKVGNIVYGSAYIDFGRQYSKTLFKRDKELILFLVVFAAEVKTAKPYSNLVVPKKDATYRLGIQDLAADAAETIESMKRDVNVVNIISSWSKSKLETYLKLNSIKETNVEEEIMRLRAIELVKSKKELYDMFLSFNENFANISTEMMDLIKNATDKGVIGYRVSEGFVEYGFLNKNMIDTKKIFHKHAGGSFDRDALEEFLMNNNHIVEEIKGKL